MKITPSVISLLGCTFAFVAHVFAAPPTITSSAPTSVALNQTYHYQIDASDPEGSTLSYSIGFAPSGVAVSNAGLVSWSTTLADAGQHLIKVVVEDEEKLYADEYIELSVIDPNNQPPVISTTPLAEAHINSLYQFDTQTTDPDGDSIVFSIDSSPQAQGLSIDENGVVSWLPASDQIGEYWVWITADDQKFGVTQKSFNLITIDPANNLPVIANRHADTVINVGQNVTYDLHASDADGDFLNYSLQIWPEGTSAVINNNGVMTWTPTLDNIEDHFVIVNVNDGKLGEDSHTFKIVVVNTGNAPPTITSSPITDIQVNTVYQYDVDATDPENNSLSYAFITAPADMNIDASSGVINWTSSASGDFPIVVAVNDGINPAVTQSYTLTVSPPPNSAPVASDASVSTNEDNALAITLQASDTETDPLTYSLQTQPSNGALTGTAPNYIYTPNENFNGADQFTFIANDGQLNSALATVSVDVVSVNDVPQAQGQTLTTNEDIAVNITLAGTDIENDPLTYIIDTQPANGVLSGSAPNLVYTPNANGSGADQFTFTVNDGQTNSSVATINIDIVAVNDAPQAQSQVLATNEDASLNITLVATDTENDLLTFIINTQPANGTLSGSAPNLVYTPEENFNGADQFTFTANDGQVNSTVATVSVDVVSVNDAPQAQGQTLTTNEDTAVNITLAGTDIENDPLTYIIDTQPANGVLSGSVPNLVYTPAENYFGSDTLTYHVTDGVDSSASSLVAITLTAVNDGPVLSAISDVSIAEGELFSLNINASDVEGDALTYSLTSAPAGMQIDNVNGNISWQTDFSSAGSYQVSVSVTDGQLPASQTFSISVSDENHAPVFTSSPITFVVQGELWQYTLAATDADGDALSYAVANAPAGVSFDTSTHTLSWSSVGQDITQYPFQVSVSDSAGSTVLQDFNLDVLSVERTNTNEGTEFWIPASINYSPDNLAFRIYIVSRDDNTSAVIDWPIIGLHEQLNLNAREIQYIEVTGDEVVAAGLWSTQEIIENGAVHINADNNIFVYVMSQRPHSTDGHLALPVNTLGKSYVIGDYQTDSNLGNHRYRNGIMTIVATEDNTVIDIDASMDVFPSDYERVKLGNTYSIELNQGDVYNLESRGSNVADFTGSLITSDKPIAVFGQNPCTAIPDGYRACDHLVEQMPPMDSLGTEYYTVPFYSRSFRSGGSGGDLIRIIAPHSNTHVYVDGVYRGELESKEHYDLFDTYESSVHHIQTSEPVLVVQYITSNGFSGGLISSDPAMLVVPPAEQFLKSYLLNTPSYTISRNFVNIVIPTQGISSITLDGETLDPTIFSPLLNSHLSYTQLEIDEGSFLLEADESFGIYSYGYADFESYAYSGGMAYSLPEQVANIDVGQLLAQEAGSEACVSAIATNGMDLPVNGVRITFMVDGANTTKGYQFSNEHGEAKFCYQGNFTGTDSVSVSVNQLSQTTNVEWSDASNNLPPIITSYPETSVINRSSFTYQVEATDPNGDALSYRVATLNALRDAAIDENGLLTLSDVWFTTNALGRTADIVVEVEDVEGAIVTQHFKLWEDLMENRDPVFMVSDPNPNAVVGIPYIYNAEYLDFHLASYKYRLEVEDTAKTFLNRIDAVYTELLQAPFDASIRRDDFILDDGAKLDCIRCLQYLDWTPQTPGTYDFEIALNDTRGGSAPSQSFSVAVAPNLPPSITTAVAPSVALAGSTYTLLVDIDNDVPMGSYANLDNIQIVFESAPSNMRAELVSDGVGAQYYYLEWIPGLADIGLHTIRFHVTDQLHQTESVEFTLDVVVGNNAPTIDSPRMDGAEVSIPYQHQVVANDIDGDPLSYSILVGPAGMEIDSSGLITWTPPAEGEDERYVIWVAVDDGRGGQTINVETVFVNAFANRAPVFIPAYRPKFAKVGEAFTHQVQATDREGDLPILYSLSTNGGATIDSSTGTISWIPDSEGRFWLTARAHDSLGNFASAHIIGWNVDVVSADAVLDAEITIEPSLIDLGESVTVTIATSNEASTPTATLMVDGIEYPLDSELSGVITPTRVGRIPVSVTITDGTATITRETNIFVRDPADATPPVVSIDSPTNSADITAPTTIFGTAQDDNLVEVLLLYKRADQPLGTTVLIDDFIELYRGSGEFANQAIAEFDTTLLVNGSYHLLLQATDSNNLSATAAATVSVSGDFKVGHFSFTVQDLNLDLAGMPIQVSRTYDSRRKDELLDFGYGWTVDYQNLRLEESREPTQGWTQYQSENFEVFDAGNGSFFQARATCIIPAGDKHVTVTLPNGDVEKFRVVARPTNGLEPAITNPDCYLSTERFYDVRFVAEGGTQSTLTSADGNSLYLADLTNGYLAFAGDDQAWPITDYVLTTRTGYIYTLDQDFGIHTVEDPNGFILTYTDTGITHSSGKAITFERNVSGQIDAVVDPRNNRITYRYDSQQNLRFVDQRDSSTTEYTYNTTHGLMDIIDPLNRTVIQNIYDQDTGRLVGQRDQNGVEKTFDHNIDERTSIVTDLDGRATIFNYDDRGNVLEEIQVINDGSYSSDITTTYTYDANDNQETKTIGASTWTTLHNDDEDVTSSCNPLNQCVLYQDYNERGQEGGITDERGHRYDMHYNAAGQLTRVQSPEIFDPGTGLSTRPEAENVITSPRGLIDSTTDLRGLTTTYTYYLSGTSQFEKHTESNPVSGTITYTYDANDNVETETRERTVNGVVIGETTTYTYDALDRVTRTTYPGNSYTETVFDLAGNVDRERDRFGNWVDYDYDAYNRLRLTTYADTSTEVRTYTPEGLLDTVTDRSGRVTRNEYDDAGRLWRVHNESDNTFTETRYTLQGWVEFEWDAVRNLTEYRYDTAGRRERVIRHLDGGTQEHSFTYYPNGELHTETDALGRTTTYILNELDQRVEVQYHNNSTMQERFDVMGTRTHSIDQENRSTHFGYDDLGRLTSVTPEVSIAGVAVPATVYTYDEAGNRLTQTDTNGHTTTWTYDSFGRVLTRTLPEAMSESFAYTDGQGCVVDAGIECANADSPRTTVHTDFNGDTITTAYDLMGRMISVLYSKDGNSEVTTYYSNDQVHTVTDQHGTTEYIYDDNNRLEREIRPDGTHMDYDYDAVGNRTLVRITRGGVVSASTSYTYDELNRLDTTVDSTGTTDYDYDTIGNLDTVTYPNGLVTDYDYNSINQLTDVFTRNALNVITEHFHYTLTPTGRREVISELDGRSTAYCYDNLYRLSDEVIFASLATPLTSGCVSDTSGASHIANYQYDWAGNRDYETVNGVQTDYSYDANDRLTQTGGTTYIYDDNGNTLTETLDGVIKTYTWDGKNKLVAMDESGASVGYTYNHNGIRTSKTESGNTTQFIVDENRSYAQVLEEVTNGVTSVSYVYGHDLISQERNSEVSYYHYDGLGSTRALSNAGGSFTDTYDYEAFGEALSTTGSTENIYRFTGEQFDGSQNKYYLRARYYDQNVGRFTQMDTWEGDFDNPITLNKYLYANADPALFSDPSGNIGGVSIGGAMIAVGIMAGFTAAAINNSPGFGNIDFGSQGDFLNPTQTGLIIILMMSGSDSSLLNLVGANAAEDYGNDACKLTGVRPSLFHAGYSEALYACRHFPGHIIRRFVPTRVAPSLPQEAPCAPGFPADMMPVSLRDGINGWSECRFRD